MEPWFMEPRTKTCGIRAANCNTPRAATTLTFQLQLQLENRAMFSTSVVREAHFGSSSSKIETVQYKCTSVKLRGSPHEQGFDYYKRA